MVVAVKAIGLEAKALEGSQISLYFKVLELMAVKRVVARAFEVPLANSSYQVPITFLKLSPEKHWLQDLVARIMVALACSIQA